MIDAIRVNVVRESRALEEYEDEYSEQLLFG
jgi:hypothetical protein